MLDSDKQAQIIVRLNRAEGQLGGIRRMIQQPRRCIEILQQLSALRAAISSISSVILHDYVAAQHIQDPQSEEVQLAMKQLAETTTLFVR